MKTIAIDTATSALSIATFSGQQLNASHTIQSKRQHGELLVSSVNDLIEQLNWQVSDIEKIIIAVGPGSYTGLRMGTTLAKVWAAELKLELSSVSSLALMAASGMNTYQNHSDIEKILFVPLMDARRQTAYTGAYSLEKLAEDSERFHAQTVISDRHIAWEEWLDQLARTVAAKEIEQIVLIGQEIEAFEKMTQEYFTDLEILTITDWQSLPHTSFALHVAQTKVEDPNLLVPNYGHATLAEKEWAEKNNREVASEEENETYIEHYS